MRVGLILEGVLRQRGYGVVKEWLDLDNLIKQKVVPNYYLGLAEEPSQA
jgi:hypothetical protein